MEAPRPGFEPGTNSLHLTLKLLLGMDYIFALSRILRGLGTSVSSLYGAPANAGFPRYYPAVAGLHRYPEKFIPKFLSEAAYFIFTGSCSTVELSRKIACMLMHIFEYIIKISFFKKPLWKREIC